MGDDLAPLARTVRVRMYNVGFGDCLLFFIPTEAGERTMLVDCGSHMSGVVTPLSTVTADLLAAVGTSASGKPRIDIVVATHRHYDHISGFALKVWNTVEVGEVWLPWTEERGNPAADELRTTQHRVATALAARFPSAESPAGWLALNSLSNAAAETMLLKGFLGQPIRRYLPTGTGDAQTFTSALLPGIVIHALGPSHNPATIATLTPTEGNYFPLPALRAAGDAGEPTSNPEVALFPARFGVTPADYARRFGELADRADAGLIEARAESDFMAAASALEEAVNGTSLVLGLEIGQRCLLLGGDAEWGTWSEVLADNRWRELLRKTLVYKVSHHGSYNGTPKPFVRDLLPSDAISLVSLCPMEKWPSIPRTTLLDALADQQRTLLRTDQLPASGGNVTVEGTLSIELCVDFGS